MISDIMNNNKIFNLNKDIYTYNIMNITDIKNNLYQFDDYNHYKFDIKNMSETLNNFVNKLKIFKTYDGKKKLWIDQEHDLLITDDSYYFQKFIRWWYVQNRDNITNYLEKILEHYKLFIQMINVGLNHPLYKSQILEIHDKNVQFLMHIKHGLLNMLLIYPYHDKLKIVINSFDHCIERYYNTHSDKEKIC